MIRGKKAFVHEPLKPGYNPLVPIVPIPNGTDPASILIVLPTWVGDFIMATPTLRAIRSRFPRANITFLLEPNLRELVRGGEWMNDTLEWPAKSSRAPWSKPLRSLVREIRARRFDWAVLLPNAFRAAFVVWAAGVKRRIGYDRDGRGFLLTDRIPVRNRRSAYQLAEGNGTAVKVLSSSREVGAQIRWYGVDCGCAERPFGAHAPVMLGKNLPLGPGRFIPMPLVHYYADLAEHIGCPRPDDQLELFTTGDCDAGVESRLTEVGIINKHPLVVISPGAKFGAAKCWPAERFAQTADKLIERYEAAIVITCGPGEEKIAREIQGQMSRPAQVFADPLLTLGELKSLIARCDLLLCNDAGPRHFAKAFGVPAVTVFGPTHPEWTATSYENERIARVNIDCGPCQQRVCPLIHHRCMKDVSVEMVLQAADDLLHSVQAATVA